MPISHGFLHRASRKTGAMQRAVRFADQTVEGHSRHMLTGARGGLPRDRTDHCTGGAPIMRRIRRTNRLSKQDFFGAVRPWKS